MSRPKGSHLTEEHKQKLSESQKGLWKAGRPKGYKMSEEAKNRISAANKGRQTTLGMHWGEDTRKRMSESHIGQNTISGMKGKHHTEETKLKMSLTKKQLFLNNPNLAINTSANVIPYTKYGYLLIINGILFDSISSAARFYGFKTQRSLAYLIKNNQSLLYKKYGLTVDYISEDIVKKNRKSEEFEIIKNINKDKEL